MINDYLAFLYAYSIVEPIYPPNYRWRHTCFHRPRGREFLLGLRGA
ncbi:Uncharacterised protein [Vibrio cholerae]|nr:Uncharacterised protein [Vibrio cholerae]